MTRTKFLLNVVRYNILHIYNKDSRKDVYRSLKCLLFDNSSVKQFLYKNTIEKRIIEKI